MSLISGNGRLLPNVTSIFHVKLRSAFDYVAKILTRLSPNPQQVPAEGFNKLRNWLEKSDNRTKFGEVFSNFVLNVDWFKEFKDVRDEIIHRGAYTMVFLEKDTILF